ncbi:MAG: PEP-CTERM sorting domain-containing protein [Fischerella sp.]|nr:PEP-CTERM sorting domain-containing protein [Fischerella sp.]
MRFTMKLLTNTTVAATLFTAGFFITDQTLAASVTFKDVNAATLELFDESGKLVGSGRFTYKPFSGSFVQLRPGVVYENPQDPILSSNVASRFTPPEEYSLVNSFSADLLLDGFAFKIPGSTVFELNETGQSFLGAFVYFWKPTNFSMSPPGPTDVLLSVSGGDPRSPLLGTRNSWDGCLPTCGISQRDLFSIGSDGTWGFLGFPVSGQGPISSRGRWKAAAVPEPTTIGGTLLLLVGLIGRKRKKQPSK